MHAHIPPSTLKTCILALKTLRNNNPTKKHTSTHMNEPPEPKLRPKRLNGKRVLSAHQHVKFVLHSHPPFWSKNIKVVSTLATTYLAYCMY